MTRHMFFVGYCSMTSTIHEVRLRGENTTPEVPSPVSAFRPSAGHDAFCLTTPFADLWRDDVQK